MQKNKESLFKLIDSFTSGEKTKVNFFIMNFLVFDPNQTVSSEDEEVWFTSEVVPFFYQMYLELEEDDKKVFVQQYEVRNYGETLDELRERNQKMSDDWL